MQKHLLFGLAGLIVGLAVGFYGANRINRDNSVPLATATEQPVNLPDDQDGGGPEITKADPQVNVADTIQKADAEPENFAAQMKAGDMYAKIKKFDKAIEYYKRGLAIQPENFQANIVMANANFDAKQFEEAEIFYNKALLMNPKDVNARTDLGSTFVERKIPDYDRAIKEFRKAQELEPKHEPTLYYLGVAYFRKGDTENANKALAELEKANPASQLIARLRQNMSLR